MNSLLDPRVHATLTGLHSAADSDGPRIAVGLAKSLGLGLKPHHMKDAYIAVSRGQGRLLYALARSAGATNIVEFGTSFGISALYLGAAARDNGGHVVTTEIETNKIEAATQSIRDAGLDDVVRLLPGDVMETLAGHPGPIDFLFLDGWNDLYIPLTNMLGPRLKAGATIAMDNASFPGAKAFLTTLRASRAFVTTLIESDKGAMEVGCFTGPWEPLE